MMKQMLLPILLVTFCASLLEARSLSMGSAEVDNRIGEDSKKHEAWVRISESSDMELHKAAGSRFELECEAVGSPPPSIQWLKDGQVLAANAETSSNLIDNEDDSDLSHALAKQRARLLLHAPLQPGHEETYTCIATSGPHVAIASTHLHVSPSANRSFSPLLAHNLLGVHSSPRIVLYDTIYMDNIGEEVILPCAAVGSPTPDVFWLDPSEQAIEEDNRHKVLPDGGLRISSIRWNDMGPYTCVARNAHGQDNVTTFLYPMLAEK